MGLVVPYKSTGQGGLYTEFSADIIGYGAGIEINVILGGVTFHLSGDGNNPHERFTAMTATMEIVNDRDAVTDFISARSTHTEEEFFCKITKNGVLVFIGQITADGGEWQDLARVASPTYKLIAYDGMGRMQGKNYADDSDNPYTGYATIPEIIYRCLVKTGTTAHFAGTFFAIVHDNTEDSQVVSGDPLGNQRVDQAIFYEIGQDTGTYNYKTCEEVLESILVAYNLCLRYVGPYFLLYNPKLMTSGASAYAYGSGGTYSGVISVGSSISILDDKSLDANRKGISNFGALPPLYKARITYDHGPQDVNLLFGVSYEGDNIPTPGPLPDLLELGSITVNNLEIVVLRFNGKLRTKSHSDVAAPDPRWHNHRYHFKLRLKVVPGAPDNPLYWQRNHEAYDFYATTFSNYDNPIWNNVEEEYDWVSDIIDEAQQNINLYKEIGFDTKPLPYGVLQVYFSWQFIRVYDEKEEDVLAGGQNPVLCEWEFSDLELTALEDGTLLKRPTKTVSEGIGSNKNAASLDETTIIGDGPGKTSLGRIQVYDGAEWRDSALWGGQKLHIKSVKEIAQARNHALRKLLGGFYALNAWFDTFVTYNGIIYWPLDVQYTSGHDDWDGIWVEVGSAGGTITTKEKRVLRKEKVDIPLNPNRLPDDEELQWRITIPQTKEAHIPTGGPYGQLEMRSPAPRNLWRKGDLLNITDPVIGYVNELTLIKDVLKDDTIIYFEPWTPTEDFPPGSYLELNKLAEIQDAGENVTIYRYHEGFTGSSINVISGMTGDDVTGLEGLLLPDELHADMTRAIYSKRVEVIKNGQKLMYLLNVDTADQYDRGFYGTRATDTIHFYEPLVKNTLEIYIKKIYKEA